ncbi:MAG TPA: hypothetical protein VOB72_14500 [Candidatus Dormibacteraeota bacterium]|nr:hypothetical protein [Candidatus Dormibacteraeota bacterium]
MSGQVIECKSCGHLNDPGVQFCENCHAFLEWQGTRRSTDKPQSAVTVTLDGRPQQVVPGATAECRVRVRNEGTIVDEFRLEVVGGAAAWAKVDPPVLRLFPHSGDVARVTFSPPRSPSVSAGPTRYGVKVTSTVSPDAYTVENDLVDVAAFEDWSADLQPRSSRGEGAVSHAVRVQNRGNVPLQVAVSAQPGGDGIAIEGVPASLTVPPGEAAEAKLIVRPLQPAPPESERTHPFQAVVESLEGRRVTLDGAMVQRGRALRVEWYARLVPPSWRASGPVEHQVQVLNRGEEPITVGLHAQDPTGALAFQLSAPSLTVAPGAEAEAVLQVSPREALRRGAEQQRPFRVVATGPANQQTAMDGLLVQVKPGREVERTRGGWWRWGLAAVLLAILIGGGAAFALNRGGDTGGGGGGGGTPVHLSVLDEIGTSRCETAETVQVSIDGQDRGTLNVDNKGRTDATLKVTVNGAGSHDYQLTATGTFNVQGRTFQIHDGGSGKIDASDGSQFTVEVDEKVLPAGRCPAPGGKWPLLLRKQ